MIGQMSSGSLVVLVVTVLYLPSTYPPGRFTGQVRLEHGLAKDIWGQERTTRILFRMLDWQLTVKMFSPVSRGAAAHGSTPATSLASERLAEIDDRLLGSSYFQSMHALLSLVLWRLSIMAEWLSTLYPFTLAALLDGFLRRIVKSKELIQHNPEIYTLCICAIILTLSLTILAFTFPVTLPPLAVSMPIVVVSVFVNRLVTHFHYHG